MPIFLPAKSAALLMLKSSMITVADGAVPWIFPFIFGFSERAVIGAVAERSGAGAAGVVAVGARPLVVVVGNPNVGKTTLYIGGPRQKAGLIAARPRWRCRSAQCTAPARCARPA